MLSLFEIGLPVFGRIYVLHNTPITSAKNSGMHLSIAGRISSPTMHTNAQRVTFYRNIHRSVCERHPKKCALDLISKADNIHTFTYTNDNLRTACILDTL